MKTKLLALSLLAVAAFAATIKVSYRATNTSLTITALNSLANSTSQTTGIWESAVLDNTTNLDVDEIVTIQATTGASGVSASGFLGVYVYGCLGGTTTCTDGLSGTQGTASLTNPTNLIKVATCNAVANSTAYVCGPFSVSSAFGGTLPPKWGVVIQNNTGAALASSGNSVAYDSVQMTSN
jgi:hypothetical protein